MLPTGAGVARSCCCCTPTASSVGCIGRCLRRRVVWDNREQLFAAYQGKDAFAAWDEDVLWDYINHGTHVLPDGRIALKCSAEVEAQVFATTMSLDIFSQVDKIDCPV